MRLLALICLTLSIANSHAAVAAPKPAAPLAPKVVQVSQDLPDGVFFNQCANKDSSWITFRQHCYLYSERLEYWYTANEFCKGQGGFLVSILDQAENTFVSKLTYCESAWTGRYAVNVDQLNSPSNYRWSDNSRSSFHAHNFSRITSVHQPLISIEDMLWFNNVYHAKQRFVCKVPNAASATPAPSPCPKDWRHLNGHCYFMPHFTATYIEADFYCSGRNAHVASLHNDAEVRSLSLLDLSSNECPVDVWVGLVKLNPCRADFSTGASVCYRWADRSGDYKNFPRWHAGSPNNDLITNCVALKGRSIRSGHCYERLRFACKKKA